MTNAMAEFEALLNESLEIDTPAIASLRASMQQRHQQIAGHYESGAIGLTRDGLVTVRVQ